MTTAVNQLVPREFVLAMLRQEVAAVRPGRQGGVIMLAGRAGSGKSVVAQQFIQRFRGLATLYAAPDFGQAPPLPELRGISVIDQDGQFGNCSEALRESVEVGRSVVVLITNSPEISRRTCGEYVPRIIHVAHWSAVLEAARQAAP